MMRVENNKEMSLFGLEIAGNSAGYLQQTGEVSAFATAIDSSKPQALFPFYIPQANEEYLSHDPYSSNELYLPAEEQAKVQMEPELALKLSACYDKQGQLIALKPIAMIVMNDATYRNAKVVKLAEKKNWGKASKGLSCDEIKISSFSSASDLDRFRLCGLHQRNGDWQLCGDDVALTQYSYFYDDLLQWLIERIESQQEQALFHNIQSLLQQAERPETILVAIGASRYSAYGEQHQLLSGDQTAVILYDSEAYDIDVILDLIKHGTDLQELSNDNFICLQQQVI